MKIVIPMAGKGSRFVQASENNPEYRKPKPLINILGKPMIVWALESLPFVSLPQRKTTTEIKVETKDLIFICRQDHQNDYKIGDSLKKLFGSDISIIYLDQITRGATETVLKAKELINDNEPIIVSDCDHYFDGQDYYQRILDVRDDVDGIIPVFSPPDSDPKWSFTLFDESKMAIAVGEKDAELAKKGAWANIGAYYFSSGKAFIEEAEAMIEAEDMYGVEGKKEFYLAPMYNRMLQKGKKIAAAPLDKVWGLGTPKDLEEFVSEHI